jgi:hypothetical protein
MAMRACSTRHKRQGQDFLQQTPQLDRPDICWREVPEGCVTGSKNPFGMEIEGQESPLAGGRLIWPQRTIMTRNMEKGLLPPQMSSGTLLAAMATVWNGLSEAIKSEQSGTKNKKKFAVFCSNIQQRQI